MRYNADHSQDSLSAAARKSGRPASGVLIFIMIVTALGIMMLLNHRNSVINVLETGQCLAEEGAGNLPGMFRNFLHHAYRWIF